MERDIRDFRPGEGIVINSHEYLFVERKTRPGKIHVQEGSQANVAKVKDGDNGHFYALKVFKASYRKKAILDRAKYLKQYAHLPGLKAANNEVVNPYSQEYELALKDYPFLQYSIIMPWVPSGIGTTWSALRSKQSISRYPLPTRLKSQKRALSLATVLHGIAAQSIVHCDLCPKNIVIGEDDNVYLIDLENFHHHDFPPPPWGSPGGQTGYRHKSIDVLINKQYSPFGDVFAGALLICELLTWHDPSVRGISLDESYFKQSDIQTHSKAYRMLKSSLREISVECETLFDIAWKSEKLEDCPNISQWANALEKIEEPVTEPQPSTINTHAISRRKVGRGINLPVQDISEAKVHQPASPHISRRINPSQLQSKKPAVRPVTQPTQKLQSAGQKPIIHTTSSRPQSNSGNELAGIIAVVFVLIIVTLIILAAAGIIISN